MQLTASYYKQDGDPTEAQQIETLHREIEELKAKNKQLETAKTEN